MATRMQQRRGTAAQWTSSNPILADGEIGYAKDAGIVKIGNGVTAWNSLPSAFREAKELHVIVKDYGAKGDGTTNDSAAIQSALDVTGPKTVWFPPGNYKCSNMTMSVERTVLAGNGKLIKNSSNPMFTVSGNYCGSRKGLEIDGESATYTGPAFTFSAMAYGCYWDTHIDDINGPAYDLSAAASYAVANTFTGFIRRATYTLPAIQMHSNESNGDRLITGVFCGGGTLVDVAGCATTIIEGCNTATNSVIFGANAKKVMIIGCRLAVTALTVKGIDHTVIGNVMAGSLTLDSSTVNCVAIGNRTIGGVVNSGTANQVSLNANTAS